MNVVKKIGEGTYGVVYHVKSPGEKHEYALKRNIRMGVSFIGSLRELEMLNTLREHPFISKILFFYDQERHEQRAKVPFSPLKPRSGVSRNLDNDSIHFIFEKAKSCLSYYIYRDPIQDVYLKVKFMVQSLLALEYMHVRGIMHRDIKPNNILYFSDFEDIDGQQGAAKICDFGLSKNYTRQEPHSPNVVSIWYRPPELALGYKNYNFGVDIWSLGCVFYELLCQKVLFNTKSDKNQILINRIINRYPNAIRPEVLERYNHNRLKLPNVSRRVTNSSFINSMRLTKFQKEQMSRIASLDQFNDLLSSMINFDCQKRWSATQLLNHPVFYIFRDYIQRYREYYPPRPYPQIIYEINNCRERQWGLNMAFTIFNKHELNKYEWYSHRVLIHSVDFFDYYLSQAYPQEQENSKRPLILDQYNTELRYLGCLYMAIKLYSPVFPFEYEEISSPEYHTPAAKLTVQKFERDLVVKYSKVNIYRETFFEAADRFDYLLTNNDIRNLLKIIGFHSEISGLPVENIVSRYLEGQYRPFLDEK